MAVKVSSKYQVVIPERVRESAHIRAGQEVELIADGEQVVIVPVKPLGQLRGILKGVPRSGYRDKKDRF